MSRRVVVAPSTFARTDESPLRMLREAGAEVVLNPYGRRLSESEITALVSNAEGLIAGLEPLNRQVLSSATELRAIARVGIGLDNVDMVAARELGIEVSNTPDGPTESVAEMTLAAVLAMMRGIFSANERIHSGDWVKEIGVGLGGMVVLLVGCGRIGRRVARLLLAHGARVLIVDPAVSSEDIPQGCDLVPLGEGLRLADVISLHASGSEVILGRAEFDLMRDGVWLLNSARGGLIDENALVDALDSRRVRGVWCDVFSNEPYRGPLVRYPQALLTPHIGTYTKQCREAMEVDAVTNLLRDLKWQILP